MAVETNEAVAMLGPVASVVVLVAQVGLGYVFKSIPRKLNTIRRLLTEEKAERIAWQQTTEQRLDSIEHVMQEVSEAAKVRRPAAPRRKAKPKS